MKHLIKIFNLFSILFLLLSETGFVIEAANPVSAVLTDCTAEYEEDAVSGRVYRLRISLNESMQINAFQFRIEFDNSVLKLYKQVNLSDNLLSKYNKNNTAMTCANYNESNSSIFLLGLQLDDECANLDSGTIFSDVLFKTQSADVGECAAQLETVKFIVEVLEADNGNIVDNDSSWIILPNRNIEQENISEDDLNEDTGRNTENSKIQSSKNNNTDDVNKSENTDAHEEVTNTENKNRLSLEDNGSNEESGLLNDSHFTSDESLDIQKKNTTQEKDKPDFKKMESERNEKHLYTKFVYIIFLVLVIALVITILLLKQKRKN